MLAVAGTFVVAVAAVHLLMFLYAQAVVRSALDEAVRVGSRVDGGPAVCLQRAAEVREDLLGGDLGDGVSFACAVEPHPAGGRLVASAVARFRSPMPGVPPLSFRLSATAVQETAASP